MVGPNGHEEPLDTAHARAFAAEAREIADTTNSLDAAAGCISELADWVDAMADEIDRLRRPP